MINPCGRHKYGRFQKIALSCACDKMFWTSFDVHRKLMYHLTQFFKLLYHFARAILGVVPFFMRGKSCSTTIVYSSFGKNFKNPSILRRGIADIINNRANNTHSTPNCFLCAFSHTNSQLCCTGTLT